MDDNIQHTDTNTAVITTVEDIQSSPFINKDTKLWGFIVGKPKGTPFLNQAIILARNSDHEPGSL